MPAAELLETPVKVTRVPFANGTDGDDFFEKWCVYCVHDHGLHPPNQETGCFVWVSALADLDPGLIGDDEDLGHYSDYWWEVTDQGYLGGQRIACAKFEPCTEDGCEGEAPGAEEGREARLDLIRGAES